MTRQVQRVRMPQWVDPAAVYLALAKGQTRSIWLDTGPHATSGFSYISIPAEKKLTEKVALGDVTIFEQLRLSLEHDAAVDTSVVRVNGFSLGWVGWLGYELAAQTAGVPTADAATPDALFVYVDWAIEFDHELNTLDLLVLGNDENVEKRRAWVSELLTAPESPAPQEPSPVPSLSVRWRHSPENYQLLVQNCLDAITAGDAYQLCLTNEVRVAGEFDPLEVYLRLREANPSHHGGLIVVEDIALLSSSPEIFLTVDPEGHLATKPIKGTRKRDSDGEKDTVLAEELVSSEKERAENLMIVDLMRNDVGRVAQLGTVRVDSLMEVETYEHVHQLVSTVSAELAPGLTAVDALESCFPAGSMTGAPKISAMTILHGLEQGPRGMYSGAFGYLGIDGAANLAMVIRSIVLSPSGATIGTGGGITSGSDPRLELEETWVKVAPLLRALGVSPNEYS